MSKAKPARGGREFEWIDSLRRIHGDQRSNRFPLRIGDDAAAWLPARGNTTVLTVDAQVEGVHFRTGWLSWRELGHRAVSSSVSDLAAMGATPRCILVSLVLETTTDSRSFRSLQTGISEAAGSYGAVVAGGNLSSGPLSVHVTALGECSPDRLVTRSKARSGDTIWVTGSPGLAALGVRHLSRRSRRGRRSKPHGLTAALRAYRRPVARVDAGIYLARHWRPSAMIDVSDGLVGDLAHVLTSSSTKRRKHLGAELNADALCALPHVAQAAEIIGVDALSAVLFGGEDYELLLTAPTTSGADKKRLTFESRFETTLTPIGRITSTPGTFLVEADGARRELSSSSGWDHFDGDSSSSRVRH